jgi:hypothetical protein
VKRDVVWSAWDGKMLEHLRLTADGGSIVADGVLVGVREGHPLRARYEVRCDGDWGVLSVRVAMLDSQPFVDLTSDGHGNWTTADGEAVPGLAGCMDVDISATPFTNTLPIRRLGLAPGGSEDISVVFIGIGEMRARTEPQRYTCLERRINGGVYRFEALGSGFAHNPPIDLPVDADGLVLDYPGLFRRAFSG